MSAALPATTLAAGPWHALAAHVDDCSAASAHDGRLVLARAIARCLLAVGWRTHTGRPKDIAESIAIMPLSARAAWPLPVRSAVWLALFCACVLAGAPSESCDRQGASESFRAAAERHLQEGRFSSAVVCYDAAAAKAARDGSQEEQFVAHIGAATAELNAENEQRAVARLQIARQFAGDSYVRYALLHVGLAEVQLYLGNLPAAASSYEAAYALVQEDDAVVLGLGLVYEAMGRKEEALTLYKEAMDSPVEAPIPRVRAAELLVAKGEFSSGRRLIEGKPGSSNPYHRIVLAEALAGQGNLQKALDTVSRAGKSQPGNERAELMGVLLRLQVANWNSYRADVKLLQKLVNWCVPCWQDHSISQIAGCSPRVVLRQCKWPPKTLTRGRVTGTSRLARSLQ